MPKKLDEIHDAIVRKLKGKTNPRTKKPYTDSELWAIARAQYNKLKGKSFEIHSTVTKMWESEGSEIEKTAKSFEKKGQRFIETVISGLAEDRDGEMMSQEAIDDMIKQLKSGTIGFFGDHGRDSVTGMRGVYSWKGMMGVWVDGTQEGKHLKATLRLNNAHPDSDLFWAYHKEGMPIGLSIGAKAVEAPEIIEVDE